MLVEVTWWLLELSNTFDIASIHRVALRSTCKASAMNACCALGHCSTSTSRGSFIVLTRYNTDDGDNDDDNDILSMYLLLWRIIGDAKENVYYNRSCYTRWFIKNWIMHALRRSKDRTFSKMINLDHCSKVWSCWTLFKICSLSPNFIAMIVDDRFRKCLIVPLLRAIL